MYLKLPYKFKNKALLERALTHSSYINESNDSRLESYERLEFLGDAVLQLAISEELFSRYPGEDEGVLTKMRAAIVCESSLYDIACELELGKYIRFSTGELSTGGSERPSILSDVVESIIGAVFLEAGFLKAKEFIIELLENQIKKAYEGELFSDYKSELQNLAQLLTGKTPVYNVERESGPDHNKMFTSSVSIDNKKYGEGSGKSKKISEQRAAKIALKHISKIKT